MTQPPWITDLLNQLTPYLLEDYEERAAIMQYDGGLPRDHAECQALLNIIRKHPLALTGVSIFKSELDGATEFIVATKSQAAHLSSTGMTEVNDLAVLLDSDFDGLASLAKMRILLERQ
jgi:hypothetical protein